MASTKNQCIAKGHARHVLEELPPEVRQFNAGSGIIVARKDGSKIWDVQDVQNYLKQLREE
jgi:hypothetical protein